MEPRFVTYFLPSDTRSPGEPRPAAVVKDWGGESRLLNLCVFTDASNDGTGDVPVLWATSVKPGNGEPGTYAE